MQNLTNFELECLKQFVSTCYDNMYSSEDGDIRFHIGDIDSPGNTSTITENCKFSPTTMKSIKKFLEIV